MPLWHVSRDDTPFTVAPSTSLLVKCVDTIPDSCGRVVPGLRSDLPTLHGKSESASCFLTWAGSEAGSVDFTHFSLAVPPSRGGDPDKPVPGGKNAYSSSGVGGRRKNQHVVPATSDLDGDYSLLFALRCSDDVSTLGAEWCIIQKWPSNGQVETKYVFFFRWMKNLTASIPLTAGNIL